MENQVYLTPEIREYEMMCEGNLCGSTGATEEINFDQGEW